MALLTLRGRNEEKVKFSAEHVRKELDKLSVVSGRAGSPLPAAPGDESDGAHGVTRPTVRNLIIAGPAPAPLLRAETYYRYQIMLRTRFMSKLSQALAEIIAALALPEDVTLTVDIDPVSLS